ncbi:MAG: type II secretion system protein [Candidatus Absconditicoccaceae bacterium]
MKISKGFTLIETLIVVVIIGILSVILMRTYTFVSQISFRIQQEKNVTQETLFLSQIIQNISDKNSIDYNRYISVLGTGYLTSKSGFINILYLSGQDGKIEIYSTGTCIDPGTNIEVLTGGYQCYIQLVKNGEISNITNPQAIYVSKTIFRITPYDSSTNYLDGVSSCTSYISCIHKPGFFMIAKAYSPTYNKKRYNKIQIPIQQFFNSINTDE